MEGYSLSWLRREKEELQRDRYAFASALDILRKRILESVESDIPRRPLLHEWSGSRASVGSLEMALHAIEHTIEEMNQIISAVEKGDLIDIDAPPQKEPSGAN